MNTYDFANKTYRKFKLTLDDLGYSDEQLIQIKKAASSPEGAIIVSGIAGSGRKTTLYALMKEQLKEQQLNPNGFKAVSVEYIRSYEIDGLIQIPVTMDESIEDPFDYASRRALHIDSDLIMYDELRNEKYFKRFVETIQSGHKVFTSVHASSALGIIQRFKMFDIPNDTMGKQDFISGLIYQTPVPVLCDECAVSFESFKAKAMDIQSKILLKRAESVYSTNELKSLRFKNQTGCEYCSNGHIGRTIVAEVVIPDEVMRKHITKGQIKEAYQYHIENGGKILLDHGIEKVKNGICDIQEMERRIGYLSTNVPE